MAKPGPKPLSEAELAARGSTRLSRRKLVRPADPVASPWTQAQRDAVADLFPAGDWEVKLFGHFADRDEAWCCWLDVRASAMAYCTGLKARHPGHRPAGWWAFESPEDGDDLRDDDTYFSWLSRNGCMNPEEVVAYESSIWPGHYQKMRRYQ